MKKKNFKLLAGLLTLAGVMSLTGCSLLLDAINSVIDGGGSSPHSDANFDVDKVDVNGKTIIQQTYKDYSDNNIYPIDSCPTKGNVKFLIIPVWLSDSDSYINPQSKDNIRDDIEKAYLGTTSQTGWHSVKSYYEEESNKADNKLTITGTVSDWYNISYSSYQLGTNSKLTNGVVNNAVDWYFTNHSTDSRNNYDSDNNGYLDAVILIYGAPDYGALGNNNLSNLWAYCFWIQDKNETTHAIPNAYFWASYDFMYSQGTKALNRTGRTTYGHGDTTHCNIDAHTYIHEMGHVFGLDDYYDYGDDGFTPAGGLTMQDYNVGGHDPYSVMAFGWANPYVVTENSKVKIGTFQKTKELVLISANWNGIGSPFDEYLLLELYSPTGLNAFDVSHAYNNNLDNRLPGIVGIRMWHVDARMVYVSETKTNIYGEDEAVFSINNLTSNTRDSRAVYGVQQAFSNTFNNDEYCSVLGSKYINYNVLQLIRNDVNETIQTTSILSKNDLFTNGAYEIGFYKNQFVNSSPLKMNNGSYADWKININITGSGDNAIAEIDIIK